MSSVLAKPLVLPSGLILPNRIVKAPMTENLADSRNQPTVRHERVYRRWAEGGAGMQGACTRAERQQRRFRRRMTWRSSWMKWRS